MATDHTMDLDLDDDDFEERPAPLPWLAASLALLVLFPLLASVVGGCEWLRGARAGTGLSVAAYGAFYLATVVLALVWPFAEVVAPGLSRGGATGRILAGIAFLALPLVSFAYYLGTIRGAADGMDIVVVILIPVAIASLLIERTGKSSLAGLFLAVATFVPLFIANDLLGPFAVLFSYASNGGPFYFAHAICYPAAFLLVTWAFWRKEAPVARLARFPAAFAWLVAGAAVLGLLPAWWQAMTEGRAVTWSVADFLWLTFPIFPVLLKLRTPRALVALRVLAVATLVAQLAIAASWWSHGDVTQRALAALMQSTLVAGVLVGLLVTLRQLSQRAR